jgi:hypothetical protein
MKIPARLSRFKWPALLVLSFAIGSITTAALVHAQQVKADESRVFELMIYHTLPGKVPQLESVFRDLSKLQSRYLNVIGYWTPDEDSPWKNTFVYLIAHPSREAAERSWQRFHSDPAFPPYRQSAAPLIVRVGDDYQVDEIYMRPTEFSVMK